MFKREGFMAYVGDKSGSSYASGLKNIEGLYGVDIDTEYNRDQCQSLLAKIEQDKKRTDLSENELHKRRDYASHLRKYAEFRRQKQSSALDETVEDNIRQVLAEYKADFERINEEERYKWEAVGWYKTHWNLEADDFAKMAAEAFIKAGNLLTAGRYYPLKVLLDFAKVAPESVRSLFRLLYDETKPLAERYVLFRQGFNDYVQPLSLNHYQDLHAISVYLSFEYPDTYYIYKYGIYNAFKERVGFVDKKSKDDSEVWKIQSNNRLCELVLSLLKEDDELLTMHKARLDETCDSDEAYHMLAMDVTYYGSGLWRTGKERVYPEDDRRPLKAELDIGKNTILYGPPGTGKTYYTVLYAVAIIENKPLALVEAEDYGAVIKRYQAYKEQGRIEMTTFHQSYGYEEFIEGIRPVVHAEEEENGSIGYSIEPGLFKRFCDKASRTAVTGQNGWGIRDNAAIWKVSLEGTGDNPTRSECLKNNHIRIGWDNYGQHITDETDFSREGGKNVLNTFLNRMQIGDLVLSCYSASVIDAIGVVTGEYEWHEEYPRYKRLRQVRWLVKDIRENILTITGGVSMTLAAIYRLSNITLTDVLRLIEKHQPTKKDRINGDENYVFIIDEINRGNLSKIFGELMTLLEPAKRLGQPEEMSVKLPYSQKLFGVPDNLYLVATMNTADRSLALLDTALRRRFAFREMLPDAQVLTDIYVEDMAIKDLFVSMNERIAILYDREHTLGQAYFLPLKDNPTIETLADIFAQTILPLLQEYFYEDYEKIRLVLGDNKKENKEEQFILAINNDCGRLFGDTLYDIENTISYVVNPAAFDNIDAYRAILIHRQ